MTEKEATGILTLTAQTQQILIQAQRQIELTTERVIERQSIGNVKEVGGGTEPLPQLSRAGIGVARFRRSVAFDGLQYRAQGNVKFKVLPLMFVGVGK